MASSPRQNAQLGFFPRSGLLVVFGGWQLGPFGGDRNLGDTHVLDFDNTDGVSDPEEGLAEEDSGSEAEDQMGGGGLPAGVNIVGTHPIYGPLVDMGSQGLVPLMMLMQMQMQGGAASEHQSEESDDDEGVVDDDTD